MNKSDQHAFVNQLVIYTLVMICFTGSLGMGAVWLRHKISVSANNTKRNEARASELERRIADYNNRIAAEQTPLALEQANARWQLGLKLPAGEQVVRMPGSAEQRLAARRNESLFSIDTGVLTPARYTAGGGR